MRLFFGFFLKIKNKWKAKREAEAERVASYAKYMENLIRFRRGEHVFFPLFDIQSPQYIKVSSDSQLPT